MPINKPGQTIDGRSLMPGDEVWVVASARDLKGPTVTRHTVHVVHDYKIEYTMADDHGYIGCKIASVGGLGVYFYKENADAALAAYLAKEEKEEMARDVVKELNDLLAVKDKALQLVESQRDSALLQLAQLSIEYAQLQKVLNGAASELLKNSDTASNVHDRPLGYVDPDPWRIGGK